MNKTKGQEAFKIIKGLTVKPHKADITDAPIAVLYKEELDAIELDLKKAQAFNILVRDGIDTVHIAMIKYPSSYEAYAQEFYTLANKPAYDVHWYETFKNRDEYELLKELLNGKEKDQKFDIRRM